MDHHFVPATEYLNFYQKALIEIEKILKLIEAEKNPLAKELFKLIIEHHYKKFCLQSYDNKLTCIEMKFEIEWAISRLEYEPLYIDEMQNHLIKSIFLFNLSDEKYQ